MFWRKKKADLVSLNDENDHREAYRIRPDSDRPILLKAAGNSAYLVNISGTGCCFRSSYFKEGAAASGTLTIASENVVFPVSFRVVSKQRDLCRCEFTKISAKAEELIHAYVLDVQKSQIRNH